ncbi:MAG: hypothetical protein AAF236_00860 [Verrucomicrobiota bacterium]
MKTLLFAAIATALTTFAATANDYFVDIANRSGFDVHRIFVSPESSEVWEEDVLGRYEILENGETIRVTLSGYSNPFFDIRLVDEDGDTHTFWDVNVSRRDICATRATFD